MLKHSVGLNTSKMQEVDVSNVCRQSESNASSLVNTKMSGGYQMLSPKLHVLDVTKKLSSSRQIPKGEFQIQSCHLDQPLATSLRQTSCLIYIHHQLCYYAIKAFSNHFTNDCGANLLY